MQKTAFSAEIDILVSKLLGFETFAKSLRVSVSVSENLVSKKSLGFGFGKFGFRKKVSLSVSKKFGLRKKVSVMVLENLVSEKKS